MWRQTIQLVGLWVLAAALSAGCDKFDWGKPPAAPSDASRTDADDSDSTDRPADELAALRSENVILRARVDEVQGRETQLAEKLAQSEFLVAQQQKQIRILGTLPDERDAARQQARDFQDEVQRLRAELRRLGADEKMISPPSPATLPAPSTSPASSEEHPARPFSTEPASTEPGALRP